MKKFAFCCLSFVLLGPFLTGQEGKVPKYLKKALTHENRPEADKQRDPHRKPAQVLHFFGIKRGDQVVDLMGGSGYYSEVLARSVGPKGKVYVQNNDFVWQRFAKKPLTERLEKSGLKNVEHMVTELDDPKLPGNLDAATMVLFYHDTYWQKVDREKMNRAIFEALKPGGVFGIVDHHAEAGSGDRDVQSLHRVDAALVRKEIEAAGFVFEGESDLLSHPEDTRDYNVFRDFKTKRDRTDRFVYRFRKPK